MKNVISIFAALIVLFFALIPLPTYSQDYRVGGFTPNPEITFAFQKQRYPISGSALADVSITGPNNGTFAVSVKNADGVNVIPPFNLIIG